METTKSDRTLSDIPLQPVKFKNMFSALIIAGYLTR